MLEREMAPRVQRDLFVTDQGDGGIGGGGTGTGGRRSFGALRVRAGDKYQESKSKQGVKNHIFSHIHNLTPSRINSRAYLCQICVKINKLHKNIRINNLPMFLQSYIA